MVPSGLGFELLSLREFSAGLGDWRVLRSGQSSGALCYVLERFQRGICGVAEHQDWSVPGRLETLTSRSLLFTSSVSAFNVVLRQSILQLFSLHSSHRTLTLFLLSLFAGSLFVHVFKSVERSQTLLRMLLPSFSF